MDAQKEHRKGCQMVLQAPLRLEAIQWHQNTWVWYTHGVKHLGQCFPTEFSAMMEVLHTLELPHVYVSIWNVADTTEKLNF